MAILKQNEVGIKVPDLCREHGISSATFYKWRGKPAALRCDNGPEYVSQVLIDWANKHQITLMYIQPGKPTQNAYVERFNRTVRHEWLALHLFETIEQAQYLATEWPWTYNNERPNTAIGRVPPRYLLDAA